MLDFCQMLFQYLMEWSCGFCLWVCLYSGLHWWISVYWTTLHLLDEGYLIMMDDHFDVFLDSVWKNFIEYFCIDIHKGNWSKVLFLCWVFVWFLSLSLFIYWITLMDFHILNHLCILGLKPSWSCWMIILMWSWIWIAIILLFCIDILKGNWTVALFLY